MREALLAAAIVLVAAHHAGAALIVETVELDTVTLDSYGWYASRLFTFDDPATPEGDVFFRGIVTVTLDDWTHVSLSLTTWDAFDHRFISGVVALAHADATGIVAETRVVGDTPLAPVVTMSDARTVELNTFSGACCGRGYMVLAVAGDGVVESARFATRGNPFVIFEESASGPDSFSVLDEDFQAVAHAAALAPALASEARAMVAGRAFVEAPAGEFIGAMFGLSDLGDPPEWCHLRMLGPQLDAESQGNDGDADCDLVAHARQPGRYELRVERFLGANMLSDDRADVLAHGAFVRFP